ncbi:MAG: hypothetical protein BZY80_00685 [SAR202 cluster bacterium Io17-Chloro-G2]|nr:MAG: hypothetical protein BZY80_00685 [SAR202 cluster bacterium Io17-Chloro-G2]
MHQIPVRKAVIPTAGLGTRFLPVTKSLPKVLLPILDKPMLQYVVEEAVQAGVEQIILVVSPGSESVAGYFQPDAALEAHLIDSGTPELAEMVKHAANLAAVSVVVQEQPLGLGHAVLMAKHAVGSEPFVVILPDDIIVSIRDTESGKSWPGATAQMIEVFHRHGGGVVAVEPLPWEVVHNYGVVDGAPVADRVSKIQGLVEKPPREDAPSNLAIVGRYVLPPDIFGCLERTQPGAKGEIQLTDALLLLLETTELYSYEFWGRRYDGGTPLGLLKAALEFGLAREDTRRAVEIMLKELG